MRNFNPIDLIRNSFRLILLTYFDRIILMTSFSLCYFNYKFKSSKFNCEFQSRNFNYKFQTCNYNYKFVMLITHFLNNKNSVEKWNWSYSIIRNWNLLRVINKKICKRINYCDLL